MKTNNKVDDSWEASSPDYNSKVELQKVLVKRLMYFYGPYVITDNGESLYQATMQANSQHLTKPVNQ